MAIAASHVCTKCLAAAGGGTTPCGGRCLLEFSVGAGLIEVLIDEHLANDGRTEKIIPGLFPGLSDAIPGILPLFVRFLSRAAGSAASQKAFVCWGFAGRGSRI
jgi:hypothetical protein